MKHFFTLALITVFSSFLFSCEMESVEPALAESVVSEKNTNNCPNYSFFYKNGDVFNFGKPNGKMILVGFVEGTTLEEQRMILRKYPQFYDLDGIIGMDSGVLTRVKMVSGSNCADTEKFIAKVLKEGKVLSVNPTFTDNPDDPNPYETGLTPEFLVSIEGSGTLAQLKRFVAATRTHIVFPFDENIYLLSADKYSTGKILDIVTAFNRQSFITIAEPMYTFYSFPFPGVEKSNAVNQTSKALMIDAFKALNKE